MEWNMNVVPNDAARMTKVLVFCARRSDACTRHIRIRMLELVRLSSAEKCTVDS